MEDRFTFVVLDWSKVHNVLFVAVDYSDTYLNKTVRIGCRKIGHVALVWIRCPKVRHPSPKSKTCAPSCSSPFIHHRYFYFALCACCVWFHSADLDLVVEEDDVRNRIRPSMQSGHTPTHRDFPCVQVRFRGTWHLASKRQMLANPHTRPPPHRPP